MQAGMEIFPFLHWKILNPDKILYKAEMTI